MRQSLNHVISVTEITIKRIVEEDPDLSFLGRYSNSPETKSKDEIAIDRLVEMGSGEYRYFIAANVENRKQALENHARMNASNSNDWCMLGIKAKAEYVIPMGDYGIIHRLDSGGLWGVESDSDKKYLHEIEDQELSQLRDIAKKLNIQIPDNVEIIRE